MTFTHYPHLDAQDRPWLDPKHQPSGNGIWNIPTMLTQEERRMLSYLTEHSYQGKGAIVDLGSFLGGSSAFLAHGLSKNPAAGSVKVESFDRFTLAKFEREVFFKEHDLEPPADNDSFEIFKSNIAPLQEHIHPNKGDILNYTWNDGPIEILFVDLMKSAFIHDHVIETFMPHLIPNESILILQDFMFENTGAWHMNLMEKLTNKFTFLGQTEINSVLYRCTAPITAEDLEPCKWMNTPFSEQILNVARNASRWPEPAHREIVVTVLENMLSDSSGCYGNGQTPLSERLNSIA